MKYQGLIIMATMVAFAACKTPYKATDKTATADSSAVTTDTAINQTPSPVDSTEMQRADSIRTDSMTKAMPDSAKMTPADSIPSQPAPDSARANPTTDSINMEPANDSVQTTPATDTAARTKAPEAVESAFTKQYPGATNMEWSAYDSLAAVPIDMRLTGWKKMDAEDHMVKFDFEDQTYYAWYDSEGKWIGSAYTMSDVTKLPAAVNTAVKNAIKTRYQDYTISQVNQELQTGKKAYEVELTKDDSKVRMLVTSGGKITQIFKYSAETSQK